MTGRVDVQWGRTCVVGGAGFIGSHVVDRLLALTASDLVVVFDNFSSGHEWHLGDHSDDPRLRVVRGDVVDLDDLRAAMDGCQTIVHLASNPDIARAATEPAVDFDAGTVLTHRVLEAMRLSGANRIVYASGSGIYGDLGELEVVEDHGPLQPISTYGASKLAGEAMISAYCHMFGLTAVVLRFGNVVGARQTHGVGFDFVRHLRRDPRRLRILGDGSQSKSYVHVSDVVEAIFLVTARAPRPFAAYNVATGDYVTVAEIARLAVEVLGLDPETTKLEFTGGERGWKGDVPIVRLNTDRIRRLGWHNTMSSREALRTSMESMRRELSSARRAG